MDQSHPFFAHRFPWNSVYIFSCTFYSTNTLKCSAFYNIHLLEGFSVEGFQTNSKKAGFLIAFAHTCVVTASFYFIVSTRWVRTGVGKLRLYSSCKVAFWIWWNLEYKFAFDCYQNRIDYDYIL